MSQLNQILDQIISDAAGKQLLQQFTQNQTHGGNRVTINNRDMVNFGSCSYLALEQDRTLKSAAADALERFGTQFSSSRTYLSIGLYQELENLLRQLFERPVIVTASTTLGHLAALPVLVGENDAVIMDLQVHSSVQLTAQILKARKVPIHVIKHNDMEHLEKKIKALRGQHKKIWFLADGVYSMYGDFAPMDELVRLLDTYEGLHLYIDDAHGMSWAGEHGRGYVRSQVPHHPKMVLACSLNKAYSAGGGVLVFPDEASETLVRNCGSTMIFSGPIQPPMLGAAIASAKLHLSDEFPAYQQELQELISYTNQRIRELGLPQVEETQSPIFFIPVGLPRVITNMIQRMHRRGFFLNPASFPAVPMKKGGLRFLITRHQTRENIDAMLRTMAQEYRLGLEEEGSSCEKVAREFGIEPFLPQANVQLAENSVNDPALKVEIKRSIADVEAMDWDSRFRGEGTLQHANLKLLESVFSNGDKPENRWEFFYITITDQAGTVLLQTMYTAALSMDDMFAPAETSRQLAEMRAEHPYYLTSKRVMLGSPFTKGEHLFLNREHAQWKSALSLLIEVMQETVEQTNASQLSLRDFNHANDAELRQAMLELGLIELQLPANCVVENLTWSSRMEFLDRLGSKYRYNVRKEILPYEKHFRILSTRPRTEKEIRDCYELYTSVYNRAFDLSVFKLPYELFEAMCQSPEYDILRMYLVDDERPASEQVPVAVMFSNVNDATYNAMLVGLDYEYVKSHNTYKQILFQTVMRARELECSSLDLAFTAELEKKKVGARPKQVCAYIQQMEHYSQAVIGAMS